MDNETEEIKIILQKVESILRERLAMYGFFKQNIDKVSKTMKILNNRTYTKQEIIHFFISLKLMRIMQPMKKIKEDTLIDLIGYLVLYLDVIQEDKQKVG